MNVLFVGIFMFALGAITFTLGGVVGFLGLVVLYTLSWWSAARHGVFDE